MCGQGECVARGIQAQEGMHGWGVCVARGGHAWPVVCMAGGMHGEGDMHGREGMVKGGMHGKGVACMAGEAPTVAGSTHPTGMHSCCLNFFKSIDVKIEIGTF